MQITITTDRNPEGWGSECDEITAQKAAEILAEMLADYAVEQWPEAEVEFGTTYVTSGASHRIVDVSADDNQPGTFEEQEARFEIAAHIAARSEEWWVTALEKAIA